MKYLNLLRNLWRNVFYKRKLKRLWKILEVEDAYNIDCLNYIKVREMQRYCEFESRNKERQKTIDHIKLELKTYVIPRPSSLQTYTTLVNERNWELRSTIRYWKVGRWMEFINTSPLPIKWKTFHEILRNSIFTDLESLPPSPLIYLS